tara:strand:- start:462 stop:647 length:186 start_codon:yes stop_codon:yes gene_type:complete
MFNVIRIHDGTVIVTHNGYQIEIKLSNLQLKLENGYVGNAHQSRAKLELAIRTYLTEMLES